MSASCPDCTSTAKALRVVAADVRAAGDMNVSEMSPDGVAQRMTLSDLLWLFAVGLDEQITPLRDPDEPPTDNPEGGRAMSDRELTEMVRARRTPHRGRMGAGRLGTCLICGLAIDDPIHRGEPS